MTSFDDFGLRVLCNLDVNDIEARDDEVARIRAQEKLLQDQQYAQKILPLISGQVSVSKRMPCMNPTSGHVLLVTLLLVNACANEALPMFLDELVPSWLAIVLSVTVVLIFGEIVPSAIFTGPGQLRLAAAFAPVVSFIRVVLFPLVLPISLILDKCLGHEENENRRGEIKATAKTLMSAGLEPDEVNMIHGVLDMHRKTAGDIAKPLLQAKMVAHDDIVTKELVDRLLTWGHSRVFVYRRDPAVPEKRSDIMGVLLVKKLLGVSFEAALRVDSIQQALKDPVSLDADENLLSVLNRFQDSMCHLGFVRRAPEGEAAMFCSLEDVIETMLTEDIFDEEDLELGRAAGRALRLGTSRTLTSSTSALGRLSTGRLALTRRFSRASSVVSKA
jgi:CBS domain containing-hemolysin-like protein